MTSTEQQIRALLGVPDDAANVLLLGMDAHMDWDWLNTFQTLVYTGNGYPQGSVQEIVQQAWNLMSQNQGPTAPYLYSVCEMGFLRAALETNPALLTQFQQDGLAQQLSIEGGGITSPDNLLPHGEAFVRNYLAGWAWQMATLGLPAVYVYMPDDFGHDAQLPVMLQAMGFPAISFSRMPGSWASSQITPLGGGPSLYDQIMAQGADFFWQAADGSSVLAHLEQHSYSQGNSLGNDCGNMPQAVAALAGMLQANQPSSPTPYVYLPCGNDFALPIPCLLDIATAWNNAQYSSTGTWAAVGTLQQYLEMVQAWSGANPGTLVSRAFDPTPYWTGFYASRPENKILHHATVRALLGAEVFGTIADLLQTADNLAWAPVQSARQQAVAQGWEALLPSTHHDYITGTAVDSVYTEEQVPLLAAAHTIATGARRTAIAEIAQVVAATPKVGETPVAVFNQLGFERGGLVEMPPPPGVTATSVRSDSSTGPVVTTAEGMLLFAASAESLGYETVYLSNAAASGGSVTYQVSAGGDSVILTNSLLQATLSQQQGWAVTSLQPIVNGQLQPDLVPSGQAANALTFYQDGGNLYNFGNEFAPNGLTVVTGTLTAGSARVMADRGLRVRVEASVAFDDGNGSSATYQVEYALHDGEPFLRMAITGAAPLPANPERGGTPYAVMVRFPFAANGSAATVDGVLRGTPYHWDDELPVPYWQGPTFQAAHHFVVPSAGGTVLGAIYHSDLPAWAIDGSGALIGCILRNTPASYPWPPAAEGRGANGVDFGVHRRAYALRVPQGLGLPPSSLGIFEESWGFATPLLAAAVNVPSAGVTASHPVTVQFPASFSLAAVTSGNALLTVAKEGQWNPEAVILRLYQPSNTSQAVDLSLAGYLHATGASTAQVLPVTALEQTIPGASALPVTNDAVSLTMPNALATLEITGS
ncbi:MAG TPA: hypothetical protein VF173_10480 [Thermoanaerobaculia bacterium]|nr:hypothetical protein [Thermoanaerobaculia bacterium]